MEEGKKTFEDLGVVKELCKACARVGWTTPTEIQCKAIPLALSGHDVIGRAKTGSGKTGAYALPLLQALLAKPQRLFAVVLTPTRELAFQVKDHIQALGTRLGVQVAVLTGGMDMKAEKRQLMEKPHVVVATPGRLLDHLKRTKGFSLDEVKFMVFDEADRILGVDLEQHMNDILRVIPKNRRTMLFSATNRCTERLERASLTDPVVVSVSEVHETVDTLQQYMRTVPELEKIAWLVWLLIDLGGRGDTSLETPTFMVFCSTQRRVLRTYLTLKELGFSTVMMHGKMEQQKRLASLNKFRRHDRTILVATDVASRGLDIPGVNWVINYDLPSSTKNYIHRVGRTARAGACGKALSFTTQYDVLEFLQLEKALRVKMEEYPAAVEEVEVLLPSVTVAQLHASQEVAQTFKESEKSEKRRASDSKEGAARKRSKW